MKRKPLQPITMAQVFADVAAMSDETFERFAIEATGPDAFDNDAERVEPLALRLSIDVSALYLIFNLLSFLYEEIHDDGVESAALEEAIAQIIETAKKSDYARMLLSDGNNDRLLRRLHRLLSDNENIRIFNKSKRLKAGLIPVATDFNSFVDLRPLLTEDRQTVSQLIPIVQFMISADSAQALGKSYVFQMDRRRLKALKDAVDAAIQKLDVISGSKAIKEFVKQ